MKTLNLTFLMTLMFASLCAHAETENLTCTNADRSTVVTTTVRFKGGFEDILSEEVAAKGQLRVIKFAGRPVNASITLSGIVADSAKGPYYELNGKGIEEFTISAPASQSASILKIEGVEQEINCN